MAETDKAKTEPPVTLGVLLLFAVMGRILFQSLFGFTGIEPVIPIAVLAGLFYGGRWGAIVGAGGYALSNIFLGQFGGVGSAMLFSAFAGAVAGYFGRGAEKEDYLGRVLLATLVFELIFQFWGADFIFPSAAITWSLPWILTHVIGNIVFAVLLSIWYFRTNR